MPSLTDAIEISMHCFELKITSSVPVIASPCTIQFRTMTLGPAIHYRLTLVCLEMLNSIFNKETY